MRDAIDWLEGLPRRTNGLLTPLNTGCMLLLLGLYVLHLVVWTIYDTALVEHLVLDPPRVFAGQLWRLVTASLVHHDPLDMLFVLFGLFFFGRYVETELGSRSYAHFLLAAVIATNLAAVLAARLYAWMPMTGRALDAVHGFAGVDFAVLVAFATLTPRATVYVLLFPVKAWILVTVIVAITAVYGLMAIHAGRSGGYNPAAPQVALHLAGAAFGFASMRARGWLRVFAARRLRRRTAKAVERDRADAGEVDRLLEKVSLHGLPSLTPAERRFLDAYSKRQRDGQ